MVEPLNRAAMRRPTRLAIGIVAAASLWRANVDVRAQLLLFIWLELAVV